MRFGRKLKCFRKLQKKKKPRRVSAETKIDSFPCTVRGTRSRTFSGNNVFSNKMFGTLSGQNRLEKLDTLAVYADYDCE